MEESGYKTMRESNIDHLINIRAGGHIAKQRKKKIWNKTLKTKANPLKKKKIKKKNILETIELLLIFFNNIFAVK